MDDMNDMTSSNTTPPLTKYVTALPRAKLLKPNCDNLYNVQMLQVQHKVHPDLPATTMWCYDGLLEPPLIEVIRHHPIKVRWTNDLPANHLLAQNIDHTIPGAGYDVPDVRNVVHLHGGEQTAFSDGGPNEWYTPHEARTFTYPNAQPPTMLIWHDHALAITRLNTFAGLSGGVFIIRELEVEVPLCLPRGQFEVPLVIVDKSYNPNGQLNYTLPPTNPAVHPIWTSMFLGDVILVNNVIWPYLEVKPAKYRFRMVNISDTRTYGLQIQTPDGFSGPAFVQIGTDGGYLPYPVVLEQPLLLASGERADIIVDFGNLPIGSTFIMTNTANAPYPGGAPPNPNTVGQVMQFRVVPFDNAEEAELASQFRIDVPKGIFKRLPLSAVTNTRQLQLQTFPVPGATAPWALYINNTAFMNPVDIMPTVGSSEIWEFVNITSGMHPMHVHLIQFQLINRQAFDVARYTADFLAANGNVPNGQGIPNPIDVNKYLLGEPILASGAEVGWKDVIHASGNMITRIIIRFAPQTDCTKFPFNATRGQYMLHCHILSHEDNDMMRPYQLIAKDPGFAPSSPPLRGRGSPPVQGRGSPPVQGRESKQDSCSKRSQSKREQRKKNCGPNNPETNCNSNACSDNKCCQNKDFSKSCKRDKDCHCDDNKAYDKNVDHNNNCSKDHHRNDNKDVDDNKTCKRTIDQEELVADYVVVGSGAGGASIAAKLATKFKVIVVEAGSNHDCNALIVDPFNANALPVDYVNEFFWTTGQTTPQVHVNNNVFDYTGGRLRGGSTSINGMQYVQGTDDYFNSWARLVRDDSWDAEHAKLTYRQLQRNVDIRQTPTYPTTMAQKFVAGVVAVTGLSAVGNYNEHVLGPFTQWQLYQTPDQQRVSSSTAFLQPSSRLLSRLGQQTEGTLDHNNVTILTQTTVLKIDFEGKTAVGVSCLNNGRSFNIRARKEVIVAAGVMTPPLLLRSGVGPIRDLEALGIPVVHNSPQVGKNITNQTLVTVTATANPDDAGMVNPNDLYTGGAFLPLPVSLSKEIGTANSNNLSADKSLLTDNNNLSANSTLLATSSVSQRALQLIGMATESGIFSITIIPLEPKSRGSLTIMSPDPLQAPLVNIGYLSNPDDLAVLMAAVRQTADIVANMGDPAYAVTSPTSDILASDAKLANWIRSNLSQNHHWTGSCRMAANPEDGVVDSSGRIFGLAHIRIADATIIPIESDGNTSAPTFVVGLTIGNKILHSHPDY